jgi:hypothetical protein
VELPADLTLSQEARLQVGINRELGSVSANEVRLKIDTTAP